MQKLKIGYNGTTVAALPNGITLTAGENRVDAKAWAQVQEHLMVQTLLQSGTIVEMGTVEEEAPSSGEARKPDPIVVPSPSAFAASGRAPHTYEAFVEGEKVRAGNMGAELLIEKDPQPEKVEPVKVETSVAPKGGTATGPLAGISPGGVPLVNTPSDTPSPGAFSGNPSTDTGPAPSRVDAPVDLPNPGPAVPNTPQTIPAPTGLVPPPPPTTQPAAKKHSK